MSPTPTTLAIANDLLSEFDICDDGETEEYLCEILASGMFPCDEIDEFLRQSINGGFEEAETLHGLLRSRAVAGAKTHPVNKHRIGSSNEDPTWKKRKSNPMPKNTAEDEKPSIEKKPKKPKLVSSHFFADSKVEEEKPAKSKKRKRCVSKGSMAPTAQDQSSAGVNFVTFDTLAAKLTNELSLSVVAGPRAFDSIANKLRQQLNWSPSEGPSRLPPSITRQNAFSSLVPNNSNIPIVKTEPAAELQLTSIKESAVPITATNKEVRLPPSPPTRSCSPVPVDRPMQQHISSKISSSLKKKPPTFRSPFFTASPSPPKPPRPPPGLPITPIPPLSSRSFGLVQEDLSHNPFHLLIAVTFLIKTAAKTALPIFRQFIERFPTPESLASKEVKQEIEEIIKPLGLAKNKRKIIQKYARRWLSNPPIKEKRYGVRGYTGAEHVKDGEEFGAESEEEDVDSKALDKIKDMKERAVGSAWEIGHLTKGAYALDSWRIFCRDELLGRSQDWTGMENGGDFQPEWMRVLPGDKELRACLRWMWMREGWEWDPVTGNKVPLRDEMRRAVDEGRVGYDEGGGLVILDG